MCRLLGEVANAQWFSEVGILSVLKGFIGVFDGWLL